MSDLNKTMNEMSVYQAFNALRNLDQALASLLLELRDLGPAMSHPDFEKDTPLVIALLSQDALDGGAKMQKFLSIASDILLGKDFTDKTLADHKAETQRIHDEMFKQ